MALTLVVEDGTGKADANAFVSSATATTLLEAHPFASAWTSVANKDQCIAEATATLSQQPWLGIATSDTQALAWPRAYMQTPDGYAIASNVIPLFLQQACARLAFALSQLSSTPYEDTGLMPGTELELPGGLRLTPSANAATTLPPDVRALLNGYVRGRGALERV